MAVDYLGGGDDIEYGDYTLEEYIHIKKIVENELKPLGLKRKTNCHKEVFGFRLPLFYKAISKIEYSIKNCDNYVVFFYKTKKGSFYVGLKEYLDKDHTLSQETEMLLGNIMYKHDIIDYLMDNPKLKTAIRDNKLDNILDEL